MKKVLSVPMLLLGIALAVLGSFSVRAAFDGKQEIQDALSAKAITTPADASIPNAAVHDAATAQSYGDWITATMEKATGGRSFNEIGHYLTTTGTDTDDVTKAALGPDGAPVVNPLRQIAFEASTGTTTLSVAVLAFKVGDIAAALGAVIALAGVGLTITGFAFAGLHVPAFAKRHLHLPHVRPHHA